MWRVPEGARAPGCGARGRRRGLAGLRGDAPSEARGADGSRAGRRPPAHTAARPHNPAQQAPRTPAAPINTTTGTARTRPGIQKTDIRDRMSACGGARGIRTPDLLIANETRYQLRHSPKDSHSLAPRLSALQADHRRVRHDTERERKMATCACTPAVPKAHTCDRAASPKARGAASQRFANYCARRASRTASRSRATAWSATTSAVERAPT